MEKRSTDRILVVVGLLTALFLLKSLFISSQITDVNVGFMILKLSDVWYANVFSLAITLVLFAIASLGFFNRLSTTLGLGFYCLSVILIPVFFILLAIKSFNGFQNQNIIYLRTIPVIVLILGSLLAIIMWFKKSIKKNNLYKSHKSSR